MIAFKLEIEDLVIISAIDRAVIDSMTGRLHISSVMAFPLANDHTFHR